MEIFAIIAELGFTVTAVLAGGAFYYYSPKIYTSIGGRFRCDIEYVDYGVR